VSDWASNVPRLLSRENLLSSCIACSKPGKRSTHWPALPHRRKSRPTCLSASTRLRCWASLLWTWVGSFRRFRRSSSRLRLEQRKIRPAKTHHAATMCRPRRQPCSPAPDELAGTKMQTPSKTERCRDPRATSRLTPSTRLDNGVEPVTSPSAAASAIFRSSKQFTTNRPLNSLRNL